jgi:hypothetical protein
MASLILVMMADSLSNPFARANSLPRSYQGTVTIVSEMDANVTKLRQFHNAPVRICDYP